MDIFASSAFLSIFLFICISLAGSYLFYLLHLPAGTIIGPIFMLIILQVFDYQAEIPDYSKTIISSIFGVYFALKISKLIKLHHKSFLKPVLFTVFWFTLVTVATGNILQLLMPIDSTNAYLSVIPGGIAEINLISMSYEANLLIINTFQIIRLFSVIILIPILFNIINTTADKANKQERGTFFHKTDNIIDSLKSIPIFLVGGAGSLTFIFFNFPAGGLMGSLFFVVLFQTIFKMKYNPPQNIYLLILSFLGGTIGLNIDISVFNNLPHILLPVAVINFITISSAFLLALLIHWFFKKDYFSTLLGVMPGGLVVMLSIAEYTTCDILYVTSLQTIRLLTAVVLIPNLLFFLGVI